MGSLDSLSASDEKQIASIISSAKDALTQPKITKALSSTTLEKVLKDTLSSLKQPKLEQKEKPDKFLFTDIFLKSVPELPATSALDSDELAINLIDMFDNQPENGDEIIKRLALGQEPLLHQEVGDSDENEIETMLAGALNTVQRKLHSSHHKHTPEIHANLVLKEIPQLSEVTTLSETELKDKLKLLHAKENIKPSEIMPLLHLDPNVATKNLLILKSTETTQQPELFTIKLKTKKDDLGAQTLIDDSDVSHTKSKTQSQPFQSEELDIKLRPVSRKAVLEDEQILKTEDLQQYLDDLSDKLKDMKLKPTQLDPVVRRNLGSKNDEKIINKAVKAAQKATQQKHPPKPLKSINKQRSLLTPFSRKC